MVQPPLQRFDRDGMHRLIPSRFSHAGTVLAELAAGDEAVLDRLIRLDGATNDRLHGEQAGLVGISPYELVYGIPNDHIVRAAFLHPSPAGSRFNDSTRGAWYAADRLETSLAEVSYHKAQRLAEIVIPDAPGQVPDADSSTYDDWLADFHGGFHTLTPAEDYAGFLLPAPVPACYAAPQALARQLLQEQSNGIVYPRVRRRGARCVACFRPALVCQPRRDRRYQLTFRWDRKRYRRTVHEVPVSGE